GRGGVVRERAGRGGVLGDGARRRGGGGRRGRRRGGRRGRRRGGGRRRRRRGGRGDRVLRTAELDVRDVRRVLALAAGLEPAVVERAAILRGVQVHGLVPGTALDEDHRHGLRR